MPRSLQVLNMQGNGLHTIPSSISDLKQLYFLDLSRNSLEWLPRSLKELAKAQFSLSGNPFLRIPAASLSSGDAVRTWLAKEAEQAPPVPQLKVLLMGHAGSGKTSMLQTLQQLQNDDDIYVNNEALSEALLVQKRQAIENFSTIGVESVALAIEPRLKFVTWDFSGQVRFFFISPLNHLAF